MSAAKPALLLIFLTVFIDLIGFGIIIPVLPRFATDFGADASTVAWLVISYSLMQFLLMPFWGRLSDRIGRRPVLLISLAASCIGYLIWGFAGSLPMLFLSRLVAGAGNANIAVAQAYITDVTTVENRAKGMGMIGAAFGLGFTFGPAIGGFASSLGLSAVGFIAAAFSGLALVLALAALPEPESRSQAGAERYGQKGSFYAEVMGDKALRTPMAIFFLSTFAFAGMEATLALLTFKYYDFAQADISWLFTFIGVMMVLVQGGLIGRLSKRTDEKNLVMAGALFIALGLALVVLFKSVLGLYIACAALALGSGLNNPANQSILSKLAPADKRGGILGVGQSLSTLGRIFGPLAAGYAFQYFSMESPYFGGAVVMVLVAALGSTLPKFQGQSRSSAAKPEALAAGSTN